MSYTVYSYIPSCHTTYEGVDKFYWKFFPSPCHGILSVWSFDKYLSFLMVAFSYVGSGRRIYWTMTKSLEWLSYTGKAIFWYITGFMQHFSPYVFLRCPPHPQMFAVTVNLLWLDTPSQILLQSFNISAMESMNIPKFIVSLAWKMFYSFSKSSLLTGELFIHTNQDKLGKT